MWVKRSGYFLITVWVIMIALLFRIYYISFGSVRNDVEKTAGSRNASFPLYNSKGVIYDRDLAPLAGDQFIYYLIIDPRRFDQSKLEYICSITQSDREEVSAKLKKETPFVLESYTDPEKIDGVFEYEGTGRYPAYPVAQHIVGYLDSESKVGLSGVEKAYDELLSRYTNKVKFSYSANAVRGINPQSEISFESKKDTENGVVLSIDKKLSSYAESAMKKYFDRGCAVIMDCTNGEILTLSSVPGYNNKEMTTYSVSTEGELINNALVCQTVGSVFKIVVAASALINGIDNFKYDCSGATAVNGRTFTCQNVTKHGEQKLSDALSNSCNCYFISLGQLLGAERICETAQLFGLDSNIRIAKDIYTEAGIIPGSGGSLALANLSIGQGELLLSPLSVARMTAVVCNGGYLVNPKLYLGTYTNGEVIDKPEYSYKCKILSDEISNALREACIECVENGTGRNARPSYGGAGGKTASAQTGRFKENKGEILNTYFSGFYPADDPKYVITIFAIDGESGASTCAPVFREICEFINQNY